MSRLNSIVVIIMLIRRIEIMPMFLGIYLWILRLLIPTTTVSLWELILVAGVYSVLVVIISRLFSSSSSLSLRLYFFFFIYSSSPCICIYTVKKTKRNENMWVKEWQVSGRRHDKSINWHRRSNKYIIYV